ncbi:MAG: NAD(P)H-dependent oxidoreductase [Planctomycetota bacterium]
MPEAPPAPRVAVVCCSLNPESRSTGMAERLRDPLAAAGAEVDWIDLRDHDLPLCDGGAAYGHPAVGPLADRLAGADAVVLALPVYNYDANAAAKNLIELTGKAAWTEKVVGFVCSAGGRGSYMSVVSLANSLMLDFRCIIVPRFVYADDGDFAGRTLSEAVAPRLDELAGQVVRFARALSPDPQPVTG